MNAVQRVQERDLGGVQSSVEEQLGVLFVRTAVHSSSSFTKMHCRAMQRSTTQHSAAQHNTTDKVPGTYEAHSWLRSRMKVPLSFRHPQW